MKKLWTCSFLSKSNDSFEPERGDKDFDPLCLKNNGIVFVGEMNGFLEIWKRGAINGLPEIQGDRHVSLLPFFFSFFFMVLL